MDRNNPVWREYLKAIIRIQIDAGRRGRRARRGRPADLLDRVRRLLLQGLHEAVPRVPAGAVRQSSCRRTLEGTDLDDLPLRLVAARAWVRLQGEPRDDAAVLGLHPVPAQDDRRVLRRAVRLHQGVRALQGPRRPGLAATSTTSRLTTTRSSRRWTSSSPRWTATSYRQPSWCRYAAGFARGKPVIVVENPYGGVPLRSCCRSSRTGKGYDLFRMMQYEAAALGINMSVPYGAWMGSVIEDSFWAPHDVVVEIQDFIADHEDDALQHRDLLRGRGRLQRPERVRLVRSATARGDGSRSGARATAWSSRSSRSTWSCSPRACCARTRSRSRTSRSTGP